jgi:hypothetical protein
MITNIIIGVLLVAWLACAAAWLVLNGAGRA